MHTSYALQHQTSLYICTVRKQLQSVKDMKDNKKKVKQKKSKKQKAADAAAKAKAKADAKV